MSRGRAIEFLSVLALVVTLLATIGSAAQAVSDGIRMLWPIGVVGILIGLSLAQTILYRRGSRSKTDKAQDRILDQELPTPGLGRVESVAHPSTSRLEEDLARANVVLGKRIRELRHQRGLTQEDLALEANMHFTQIDRLERGLRGPQLKTILRVARGLDVKPGELLQGGSEQAALSG
jgi:ribosome-binding protein aMBF1 (putative translation factor)